MIHRGKKIVSVYSAKVAILFVSFLLLLFTCTPSNTHASDRFPDNVEGFESGLGDWYVEGGTWETGVPRSGPEPGVSGSRAHEGVNCAATVLFGNYADDTSGRLVSPPFTVPSVDQNPRLRFWHWYDFNNAYGPDFGEVQIRVGTGSWESLTQYTSNSSGVWSRTSFDLSAYAGQNVQIGFYLETHARAGVVRTSTGWYIDEVTLVTGSVVSLAPNTPQGFENGLGDWYVEGGTWETGVPEGGPEPGVSESRAHEGVNCAATVLSGNYADDTSGRLVSPPFTVPSVDQNPRLRFWHWYDFNNAYGPDFGEVQIRVGTGSWESLTQYQSTLPL